MGAGTFSGELGFAVKLAQAVGVVVGIAIVFAKAVAKVGNLAGPGVLAGFSVFGCAFGKGKTVVVVGVYFPD